MCLEVEQYEVLNLYLIFGSGGTKRSELVVWSRRRRFLIKVREVNEARTPSIEMKRRMENDVELVVTMSVSSRVDLW